MTAPPPDVVVLRGAPDAVELAALVVALSALCPDGSAAPAPTADPWAPVTREVPRGLGTTDRYWATANSPW